MKKDRLYLLKSFIVLVLISCIDIVRAESDGPNSFSTSDADFIMYFNVLSKNDKMVEIYDFEKQIYSYNHNPFIFPTTINNNGETYYVVGIAPKNPFNFYSIDIPIGYKYIGDKAFYDDEYSEYSDRINLPPTLIKIGKSAFRKVSEKEVGINPDDPDYFPHGGNIKLIPNECYLTKPLIISNYIETISEYSFYNIYFENDVTVTLGRNVKTIERNAFCKIDTLICCATTPPSLLVKIGDSNFPIMEFNKTNILVPPGCKEVYERDETWKNVASIKEYEYYVNAEFKEGTEGIVLKGTTRELYPIITWLHEGSSERYRTWTSSDETIATVDQNGIITAHNYGNVNITFTIEDERGVPFDCIFNLEVTNEAGVSDIIESDDTDTTVEVFTLNGLKVGDLTDNLPAGLYIVKSAKEAKKICIK